MRRPLSAVFATLVMVAPSFSQTAGSRYALLVGVGQYEHLTPVPFAAENMTDLKSVLVESAGYKADNVTVMTQAESGKSPRFAPESRRVRKELTTLLNICGPEDTVIVAFAGHGVQLKGDVEQFFCPADADLEKKDTLIGLREVFTLLEGSKAGVKLLFADACRDDPRPRDTRALERVKLESVTRPPTPAVPRGVGAFFACSEGQQAHSHPELKHGVFFHFVMEGLKGAAADKDGQVYPGLLETYLKREVKEFVYRKFGRDQLPETDLRLCGLTPMLGQAAVLRRSEDLRTHGKPEEDLIVVNAAVNAVPSAEAFAERPKVNVALRDFEGATADSERAKELDPKSPAGWVAKGILHRAKQEAAEALADFTEAIRIDPKCAQAYNMRGLLHRWQKRYDLALADCDEAIRLDPKLAGAYAVRSIGYSDQQQFQLALVDCNEAIRLDSRLAGAYSNRGHNYFYQQKIDLALADCNHAIRLNPMWPFGLTRTAASSTAR